MDSITTLLLPQSLKDDAVSEEARGGGFERNTDSEQKAGLPVTKTLGLCNKINN